MPLTQVKTSNLDTTNSLFFRNRVINGDMRIDQRNAGASISANDGTFTLDRFIWNMQTNSKGTGQQSTDAPPGFKYSLLYTNGSAYTVPTGDTFGVLHRIEGNNVFDLNWGTANAKTVTLSFWVKSSVTGTFGGALKGSYGTAYTYAFTYAIVAANTWEYKTITIPGPTVGTWSATTGLGITISIGLGNGSGASISPNSWTASNTWSATGAVSVLATAGATFQITGMQFEVGTAATAFEYRPYSTELQLCQRYYEKSYDIGVVPGTSAVNGYIISPTGTNTVVNNVVFNGPSYKVNKRISSPTIVIYGYSGGTSRVSGASTGADLAASSGILNSTGESTFSVYNNSGSTLTTNSLGVIYHFTSSAEL
jgi:hypothetical protein